MAKHFFEVYDNDFIRLAEQAVKFCKATNVEQVVITCAEGFSIAANKDSRVVDLVEIYRLNYELKKSKTK